MALAGYIKTNAFPGECDEAFERVREMLESSRVYFADSEITGYITSEEPPSDTTKLWLHVDDGGAAWKYWSVDCDRWCPVGGFEGELITRYRINDTVAADLDEYYGCGWKLADGSNALGVDLLSNSRSVYSIQFTGA